MRPCQEAPFPKNLDCSESENQWASHNKYRSGAKWARQLHGMKEEERTCCQLCESSEPSAHYSINTYCRNQNSLIERRVSKQVNQWQSWENWGFITHTYLIKTEDSGWTNGCQRHEQHHELMAAAQDADSRPSNNRSQSEITSWLMMLQLM